MQAHLPYPNYEATAVVLDTRRLGMQRRKILRILNTLHRTVLTPGTKDQRYMQGADVPDEPIFRMWQGHEVSLCEFGLVICEEWVRRGGVDNVAPLIETHMDWASSGDFSLEAPDWFGDVPYHIAQQSNLIRKDHNYYGPKFPGVPDDLPLVWPK